MSPFLGGRSGEALPGLCCPSVWALLGVGEGVRTGLSVSNEYSWAGYGQNWTWARASRVFGREATITPSSMGTSTVCSRSERVSLAILETCPSVQEPLWGHCPAPLGTGSLHSLHGVSKRPVHSPVLYQAKMQELNEFLKLVLVSAFFLNFPSRQGGQESCRLLQAGLCHIDSVISQKQ